MAYSQFGVNGSRAVVDGHDWTPGNHGMSSSRTEGSAENDAEEDEEDDQDEEDSEAIDEEEAQHALSLVTQWVVGSNGNRVLSRVSIRDFAHELIYDQFVRPPATVQIVDYRPAVNELNAQDLYGQGAVDFETVQNDIWNLLQGRILVGHRLWESLHLLNIRHRGADTRDLGLYLPFQPALTANAPPQLNNPVPMIVPLPELTRIHLPPVHWLPIDNPRVDPPDYAEGQMVLYQSTRPQWEAYIAHGAAISAPPPNQFRADYYL